MPSIDSSHVRNLLELLKAGTPEVEIGQFRFEETGSRRNRTCTVFYKDERILRREIENLNTEYILDLLAIPTNFSNASEVGEKLEWTHVNDTDHLREWTTPIDDNNIYIEVNSHNHQKSFVVHAPVEDTSVWKGYGSNTVKDVANKGRKFEKMDSAFIFATNYMSTYNPYEIDKLIRMEKIAREKFQEIAGVGEKRVEEIVDENHIRTYEEFKNNLSTISGNYRENAREELNKKIEHGEKIEEDGYVQEVNAKLTAENI